MVRYPKSLAGFMVQFVNAGIIVSYKLADIKSE